MERLHESVEFLFRIKVHHLNHILVEEGLDAILLREIDENSVSLEYRDFIGFARLEDQIQINWRWNQFHINRLATLDLGRPELNLYDLDFLISQRSENFPMFLPYLH